MNDESKKEVEKTTEEIDSTPEKETESIGEDTPKTDVDEKVELTKEELEKLKKKAADFDGLTKKLQLEKLKKRESSEEEAGEVTEKLSQLEAEIQSLKAEKINENLEKAYHEFVDENPWASDDEYFSKIAENFNAEGLTSKEDLVSALRIKAISLFPKKYEEYKEHAIKAKVLAEKENLSIGDGGGSGDINRAGEDREKTDSQFEALKKRFNDSLPERYKIKK